MNLFWKLNSPNRFLKISCASVSCVKRRTRVGKWLRSVRNVSVTVEQWLKQIGVYKSVDMKSAAVTKDQFMAQDDMNGKNSNVENTPAKRQSPIVNNDSAKKQRLDTQAVREGASATAVQTESNLSDASDDQVALSAKTEKRNVPDVDSDNAKQKSRSNTFVLSSQRVSNAIQYNRCIGSTCFTTCSYASMHEF